MAPLPAPCPLRSFVHSAFGYGNETALIKCGGWWPLCRSRAALPPRPLQRHAPLPHSNPPAPACRPGPCPALRRSDVAIDPLAEVGQGRRELTKLGCGPNCALLEVLVFGWVSARCCCSRLGARPAWEPAPPRRPA